MMAACFAILVGLLAVGVSAGFNSESSTMKVVFPPQGASKAPFMLAMADFGEAKYGGTMLGKLVYPPIGRICGEEECRFGCTFLNSSNPPYQLVKERGQLPFVMLIDRGPKESKSACYFLSKVYYAQMAGADAVVIVNDSPGQELSTAVPPEEEMILKLLPFIKVSAALVSMEDGVRLKDLLSQNNNDVTVQLSWQNILPKSAVVVWELWGNSNDECGTSCIEQRAFIKDMKPYAKKLEQEGKAVFKPHYLIWSCPRTYSESPECKSQCIANGAYCAPDPDGSLVNGYSGVDVLTVNLAQLCFYEVALAATQPWLWWDYVDTFGDTCNMSEKHYNLACAETVVTSVLTTISPEAATAGLVAWKTCVDGNLAVNATATGAEGARGGGPGALFELELDAQHGQDGETPISILPTVRINEKQYRGTLDAAGVMLALCAAFLDADQPAACNDESVSVDECKEGGAGYIMCNSAAIATQGRSRCINTFEGWTCDCGDGWLRVKDPDTNLESCADVNECMVPQLMAANPVCSCERCACINAPGSFKCTGELPSLCDAAHNWGGCWAATVAKEQFTACVDTFPQYKLEAGAGKIPVDAPYTHCTCPPCFVLNSMGGCDAACSLGVCDRKKGCPAASAGTGSSGTPASGGLGFASVFFSVLAGVVASCAIIGVAYHVYLRQTMHKEVRDIMSTYMPLEDMDRPQAGGGGNGGSASGGNGGGGGGNGGGGGFETSHRPPASALLPLSPEV